MKDLINNLVDIYDYENDSDDDFRDDNDVECYVKHKEDHFKKNCPNLSRIERLKSLVDLYLSDFDTLNKRHIDEKTLNEKTNQSGGCGSSSRNDVNRYGVDGINTTTLELSSYEKDLVDKLSFAFYNSRKFTTIDLNLQHKLTGLFQAQNENLIKMSKVILANFIVQPLKRVITFAKLIPDFRKLDINDQMCLLQGGSMEIFICSSTSLYDQMSNKLMNLVSKDRNIQGNDSSNIQLDILRLIWSEDVFDKTIKFLKSMIELKVDETTLILFLPLILFSPDRRDIKDRQKVYSIQSKYSFLLKKYMIWKYGLNQNTTKTYNKLLLKLVELRTLHEMHSSLLLDADPSQLEPFSLALILNAKEESMGIKSNRSLSEESTSESGTMNPTARSTVLSSPVLRYRGEELDDKIEELSGLISQASSSTESSTSSMSPMTSSQSRNGTDSTSN